MESREILEIEVLQAARDMGIGTFIFRNMLARELELNLSESLCLTYLGVRGQMLPGEISRMVGLKSGSTTTMLDRLEKKSFIRRVPSRTDRRKMIVELTELYRNESLKYVQAIQKAHKRLIAGYSDDKLKVILDFLQGFSENLAKSSDDVRSFFDALFLGEEKPGNRNGQGG